jgi:uncharacterized membrane protein
MKLTLPKQTFKLFLEHYLSGVAIAMLILVLMYNFAYDGIDAIGAISAIVLSFLIGVGYTSIDLEEIKEQELAKTKK